MTMWGTQRSAIVGTLVAGALIVPTGGLASASPVPTVAAVPAVRSPMPKAPLCQEALAKIEQYRNSSALVNDNRVVILGKAGGDQPEHDRPYRPPFGVDPSRNLWFRALTWLAVASVDASERGPGHRGEVRLGTDRRGPSRPDPGTATPERRVTRWPSAGTRAPPSAALRRCCAFPISLASRGSGDCCSRTRMPWSTPQRYGGPPRRPVSNAGIMANLTLIDAGAALNRRDLVNTALRRLASDQPAVFSRAGWSFEGSTHYQSVNIRMWEEAEEVLRRRGRTAAADRIARDLVQARVAAAVVIGPTGLPALIGNTRANDVVIRPSTAGCPDVRRPTGRPRHRALVVVEAVHHLVDGAEPAAPRRPWTRGQPVGHVADQDRSGAGGLRPTRLRPGVVAADRVGRGTQRPEPTRAGQQDPGPGREADHAGDAHRPTR